MMTKKKVDHLIIGAGVIGSSVAMHLSQKDAGLVQVVDFDLEGTLSSSELNAGGVRATWNQAINIQSSKLSIEYFASIAGRVGYHASGYLWLHRADKMPTAQAAMKNQIAQGWSVEEWSAQEVAERYAFIDKTEDLAGAIFAPQDGLINPNLLKEHFREEARARAGVFLDRILICAVEKKGADGFLVRAVQFPKEVGEEAKLEVLSHPPEWSFEEAKKRDDWEPVEFLAGSVINCAGAWAGSLAKVLGYESPSKAVRRQVSIFDCRDVDLTPYGMVVDPSGVYFHPEASNGLAGFATPGEVPGVNFNYDGEEFFTEYIWPALYDRATGFERLKHLTGWAGLYEVSPDESAIIGAAPIEGIYEAHSFSGHGAMHSYAAGLGLAELIVDSKYSTLDFSILSGNRFAAGKLVSEKLVI